MLSVIKIEHRLQELGIEVLKQRDRLFRIVLDGKNDLIANLLFCENDLVYVDLDQNKDFENFQDFEVAMVFWPLKGFGLRPFGAIINPEMEEPYLEILKDCRAHIEFEEVIKFLKERM